MSSLVTFDNPWLLLTLALLPLFWWVGRASLADLAPLRRTMVVTLRLMLVGALVFALAGTNWVKSNAATCTLFVVDASYSLPRRERDRALEYVAQATREMRATDKIGIVKFGQNAQIAAPPLERGKIVADLNVSDGGQTNVARAITTALSAFPPDVSKRIVLVSDGNENAGEALEAARSAAADSVPVDVIAVGNPLTQEVTLDRMMTPPGAKRGEPFAVKIVATSVGAGPGTLRLLRNGKYVGEQKVDLKSGKNVFVLTQKNDQPGFYTYQAELSVAAGRDTLPENNRAMSFVKVAGRPKALVLASDPAVARPLARALAAQNVDADVKAPGQMPTQMAALLNYDSIVLADVPAEAFSDTQMQVVRAAVRDMGVGLTMVGGEHGFGAGGYFKTPIEEALPVDMDIRKMRRFPGVAVAMAVDNSGSMGMGGPNTGGSGTTKLQVACEAAGRAVEALSPQDQAGIIAVDTQATTIVPLTPATEKQSIIAGVMAMPSGGGTDMSAGVEACFAMLQPAQAKIKHAILITDGETPSFDYKAQIEAYRKNKITFTLVVIQEGQSKEMLDPLIRIAKGTGGRHYFISSLADIPKIYTREIQTVSKPPIIEEPFVPRVAGGGSSVLAGVFASGSVPPLLGYDVTNPKPTAEVPLVSHRGDAILAHWQYGLGKSLAFTSDAEPRWAAQWLGWKGFGPFWAQAIRWTLKKADNGSYQTGIELDGGKGRISIDAVDKAGAYVNFLQAKAHVVGPDGQSQIVRLTQTGSGRYAGTFDATKTGSYVASVTQTGADGRTSVSSAGLAVPYSPEYRHWKPNQALLSRIADITGGRVLKDGEGAFRERRVSRSPIPLAAGLLTLALLLFPLDVGTRRLLLSWGQAGEMAAAFRARALARADARRAAQRALATASTTRLLDRKARLQAEDDGLAEGPPPPPLQQPPQQQRNVTWGTPPPSAAPPPPARPKETGPASADGYRSRLLDAKKRAAQSEDDG